MTYQEFIQSIINTRGQWNIPEGQYYEAHHIVPKCLGGLPNNHSIHYSKHENIIWLLPREHFIAHKLLAEENKDNHSLVFAWSNMWVKKDKRRYEPTPEEYEEIRILRHLCGHTSEAKSKISRANKGKKRTEEQKQKMKENHHSIVGSHNPMYGKHHSDQTKKLLSEKARLRVGEKNAFYGKHHTDETKQKISAAHKGKHIPIEQKESYSMKVICIETGIIYNSQMEASIATGFGRPAIRKSIRTGCAVGHHRFSKEIDKVHFKEI